MLTPEVIANCIGASPMNVRLNWPSVQSALSEAGIASPFVDIAAIATIRVEAGPGFQPIRELRASPTKNQRICNLQNRYWDSGYYGRGYVQLTWEHNYKAASAALGIPLLEKPDLALVPVHAARILAWYMKEMRVNDAANKQDWREVRRLVNGGLSHWVDFKRYVDALLGAMGGVTC